MKKFILSTVAVLALALQSFGALTSTVTLSPGGFTNIITFPLSGYARVTGIALTATTATNTSVTLVDTPTNVLSYVIPAYTNTISYATNLIVGWTNYFGVVNYWTNISLVDITNNLVPASTNLYLNRYSIGALASSSTVVNPLNIQFEQGIWVTNTGTGTATVSINYVQ